MLYLHADAGPRLKNFHWVGTRAASNADRGSPQKWRNYSAHFYSGVLMAELIKLWYSWKYSLLSRIVEDGLSIWPNKNELDRKRLAFYAHKYTKNSFFTVEHKDGANSVA